tara:strand:- start:833 stop:994 length:162 start_codon:yes stop_codon:yes gene_type:complete
MKVTIEYENQYGKVRVTTKEFADENHLTNYLSLLMQKGHINIEIYDNNEQADK